MINRPAAMKSLLIVAAVLTVLACAAPAPSTPPVASQLPAQPLPPNLGIPGPNDPQAVVAPQSQAGTWEVGQPQQLTLGHCGLGSPLDFDGSLWDATGGHNGQGQAPTPEQLNDVINATPVTIMLISPNQAVLTTQNGGVAYLVRHDGARAYFLCD